MWPRSLRLQTLGFRDEQVQSEFSKKENDLNFGCFVKSKILSSDAIQRFFRLIYPTDVIYPFAASSANTNLRIL